MSKVLVILGPTATGKSALAVNLAKKLGGEVISADSRQVYKGLDIGTGKITKKEMQGVPHHLLDVANPKRKFTVAQYQKLANKALKNILKRGKLPIICGGTGLYIDSITRGTIFPDVPPNPALRKRLYSKSAIAIFNYLKKIDPERAETIDPHNKARLVRAVEIATALGKVPRLATRSPSYEFIKIGLCLPKEELEKKVRARVKKMFKDGLLDEIKKLKKPARLGGSGVSENRLRELGFEYYNPTEESVIRETLKYAKRQMTWFKRDNEIAWFDGSSKNLGAQVTSFLKKAEL